MFGVNWEVIIANQKLLGQNGRRQEFRDQGCSFGIFSWVRLYNQKFMDWFARTFLNISKFGSKWILIKTSGIGYANMKKPAIGVLRSSSRRIGWGRRRASSRDDATMERAWRFQSFRGGLRGCDRRLTKMENHGGGAVA